MLDSLASGQGFKPCCGINFVTGSYRSAVEMWLPDGAVSVIESVCSNETFKYSNSYTYTIGVSVITHYKLGNTLHVLPR